jgi:hypothetical protein
MRMVDAMEFFLVAHEYGHIALGHISAGNTVVRTYGVNQPLQILRRSWGQELAADMWAFLLDKYLATKASSDDRYHAGIDFGDYLRLAPQFFFGFDSTAEDAQFVLDNKRLSPSLSEEEKETVVDYAADILAAESNTRNKVVSARTSNQTKYTGSVDAVLKGDYPPPWVRQELMRRALQKLTPFSTDSTDLAFRDIGLSVLSNLQTMNSDLLPLWVEIVRKP